MSTTLDNILGNPVKKAVDNANPVNKAVITLADLAKKKADAEAIAKANQQAEKAIADETEASLNRAYEEASKVPELTMGDSFVMRQKQKANPDISPIGQPKVPQNLESSSASATSAVPVDAPKKSLTWQEMFQQYFPDAQWSKEQREKEAKRQRTRAAITALGDGISALSNLYFTTKGAPNMFDGSNTLTGKVQERYDKLKKEKEDAHMNWYKNYMVARQMDEAKEQADRAFERSERVDEETKKNRAEDVAFRNAQAQQQAQQYFERLGFDKEQAALKAEQWTAELNAKVKMHEDEIKARNYATSTSGKAAQARTMEQIAYKMRGNRNPYKSSDGKYTYSIYDNVFRENVLSLLKLMRDAEAAKKAKGEKSTVIPQGLDKDAKKADAYVRANWDKYPETIEAMARLSELDPMKYYYESPETSTTTPKNNTDTLTDEELNSMLIG